jgi:hypothetical protein
MKNPAATIRASKTAGFFIFLMEYIRGYIPETGCR